MASLQGAVFGDASVRRLYNFSYFNFSYFFAGLFVAVIADASCCVPTWGCCYWSIDLLGIEWLFLFRPN
jgi:hypothetical protein